jgi:Uma2 family endonuclease
MRHMLSLIEEPMSLEEFLTTKFYYNGGFELCKGELVAMSPSRPAHEYVIHRISYLMQASFDRSGGACKVYGSDIQVALFEDDSYVQPDLSVCCGEDKIKGSKFIQAPDLVLEVLSKSTKKYNLTSKLELYRDFGANEYWVVDIDNLAVRVIDFAGGTDKTFKDGDIIESRLFPAFDFTVHDVYKNL